MKTLILILSLLFLSTNAFAECKEAQDLGADAGFARCENKEAVCYLKALGGGQFAMSCFKK